jgi:hypothetical protein
MDCREGLVPRLEVLFGGIWRPRSTMRASCRGAGRATSARAITRAARSGPWLSSWRPARCRMAGALAGLRQVLGELPDADNVPRAPGRRQDPAGGRRPRLGQALACLTCPAPGSLRGNCRPPLPFVDGDDEAMRAAPRVLGLARARSCMVARQEQRRRPATVREAGVAYDGGHEWPGERADGAPGSPQVIGPAMADDAFGRWLGSCLRETFDAVAAEPLPGEWLRLIEEAHPCPGLPRQSST